jgi:uncharacterized membrane protein
VTNPDAMYGAPKHYLRFAAIAILLTLIAFTLAWELWLAPLRAGGSWLALKTTPLLLPLVGIVRGRIYTYRWGTMLILAYFAEGAVRMYTEHGLSGRLAAIEVVLALAFFGTAIAYTRVARSDVALSDGRSTESA